MKKIILLICACLAAAPVAAQTTTTGNYLVDTRPYYIDRMIPNASGSSAYTDDNLSENYLLLHPAFNGAVNADEHYVQGTITAIRGGTAALSRKLSLDVNTSSAYQSDRGSILGKNEPAKLVYVTYNSVKYVAIAIQKSSTLYHFSFTGYAYNETLILVWSGSVSNVTTFTKYDNVSIQGGLALGMGYGGTGRSMLVVKGYDPGSDINTSETTGGDLIIEAATGGRTPAKGPSLEFVQPANTDGSNRWGQARIMSVAASTTNGSAAGKLVLGARRWFDKVGAGVNWYYGDDMVIDGLSGYVGIGTLTPQSLLAVNGQITAQKVKVTMTGWADYVFDKDYQLPSLQWLENYIKENRHLPDVPAADSITSKGLDLGEMNALLLKKLEEQTLYIIEMNKKIESLETKVQALTDKRH